MEEYLNLAIYHDYFGFAGAWTRWFVAFYSPFDHFCQLNVHVSGWFFFKSWQLILSCLIRHLFFYFFQLRCIQFLHLMLIGVYS